MIYRTERRILVDIGVLQGAIAVLFTAYTGFLLKRLAEEKTEKAAAQKEAKRYLALLISVAEDEGVEGIKGMKKRLSEEIMRDA